MIIIIDDQDDQDYCDKHLRPMSVNPGTLIIKGALAATFQCKQYVNLSFPILQTKNFS